MRYREKAIGKTLLGSPAYFKGEKAAGTIAPLIRQFQGIPLAGKHSLFPVVRASASTTIPGMPNYI